MGSIDAVWLASLTLDMRTVTDATLAIVVIVVRRCSTAYGLHLCQPVHQPHEGDVQSGIGIWLAAWKLHQGHASFGLVLCVPAKWQSGFQKALYENKLR